MEPKYLAFRRWLYTPIIIWQGGEVVFFIGVTLGGAVIHDSLSQMADSGVWSFGDDEYLVGKISRSNFFVQGPLAQWGGAGAGKVMHWKKEIPMDVPWSPSFWRHTLATCHSQLDAKIQKQLQMYKEWQFPGITVCPWYLLCSLGILGDNP